MYKIIQNDTVIATTDNIVYIFYGENEAYQECTEENADGFCVKIPVTYNIDGEEVTESEDTVFCLPEHNLKGDEPVGRYEITVLEDAE